MDFITPLLMILGKIFSGSGIGDFFKKQAEVKEAQLDLQRQLIIEQYKMASQIAVEQGKIAETVLDATGRKFKYFTFVMWFGPFIIGCIRPVWSQEIFRNLQSMPEWYVQSCMTIMFTVWGIQVASPVISSIFSNLTSYLSDRRSDKIELHKVNSDTYKKAYFDAMRAVKGVVTPQDVAIGEKVLDKLSQPE